MSNAVHRRGSIVVEDRGGRDLVISKSHTPAERITIEHNDRHDLLRALMDAEDAARRTS